MRRLALVLIALPLAACSRRLEAYELLELSVVGMACVAIGIFAIAGALVGAAKGRAVHGALWGFFLGPIGFLVACGMEASRADARPTYAPSPGFIRENAPAQVDSEASEQQRQYLASLPPDLREQQQRIASGYAASLKKKREPQVEAPIVLRPCPKCGGQIDEKATRCMHCMEKV